MSLMTSNLHPPLFWEEIKQQYTGLWVELTDVEWSRKKTQPIRARVNQSARKREDLLRKGTPLQANMASVILFVQAGMVCIGERRKPERDLFSLPLKQFLTVESSSIL